VPGTWFNNIAAAALLLLMLHLFVTDINLIKDSARRRGRRLMRWAFGWLPGRWHAPARDLESSLLPAGAVAAHRFSPSETLSWQLAQARRVRLMILIGSAVLIGLGASFALIALRLGSPILFALDIAVMAVGLAWARWHGDPERQTMLMGSILVLMAMIAFQAYTIDLPRPAFARTLHYFLLPISLAAFFLLRNEAPRTQLGVPLLGLSLFVVLGSNLDGMVTSFSLPDTLRPPSALACTVSLAVLYVFVHILVGDFTWLEAQANRWLSRLSAWMPPARG
jgi:hypothetical protein